MTMRKRLPFGALQPEWVAIWTKFAVLIVFGVASAILCSQTMTISTVSALHLSLPGGGRISFRDGILRIRPTPPSWSNNDGDNDRMRNVVSSLVVPPVGTKMSIEVLNSIVVRPTGIPSKGYGAFCVSPIDEGTFLGFYEGTLVESRERLDEIFRHRKEILLAERKDVVKDPIDRSFDTAAMDYVMSLDGGATFLDGYERTRDRSSFSPVHLNHADKSSRDCNCVRLLDDGRVAFFASRYISVDEELCFDYGSNFWRGREDQKIS